MTMEARFEHKARFVVREETMKARPKQCFEVLAKGCKASRIADQCTNRSLYPT